MFSSTPFCCLYIGASALRPASSTPWTAAMVSFVADPPPPFDEHADAMSAIGTSIARNLRSFMLPPPRSIDRLADRARRPTRRPGSHPTAGCLPTVALVDGSLSSPPCVLGLDRLLDVCQADRSMLLAGAPGRDCDSDCLK